MTLMLQIPLADYRSSSCGYDKMTSRNIKMALANTTHNCCRSRRPIIDWMLPSTAAGAAPAPEPGSGTGTSNSTSNCISNSATTPEPSAPAPAQPCLFMVQLLLEFFHFLQCKAQACKLRTAEARVGILCMAAESFFVIGVAVKVRLQKSSRSASLNMLPIAEVSRGTLNQPCYEDAQKRPQCLESTHLQPRLQNMHAEFVISSSLHGLRLGAPCRFQKLTPSYTT